MIPVPLDLSHEHDCNYLTNRRSRSVFIPSEFPMDTEIYSRLAAQGFRRSGDLVYRPHCRKCTACIPVRVPVAGYSSSRSQRRIMSKNCDITIICRPAVFNDLHFALYQRYLNARHPESTMTDSSNAADYIQFLGSSWCNSFFYEFRLYEKIVAVAIVDHLDEALSAVYTFFEPDLPNRSLGTFTVLWTIEETFKLSKPLLYLGYWIKSCRKMAYKNRYKPFEQYLNGKWVLEE